MKLELREGLDLRRECRVLLSVDDLVARLRRPLTRAGRLDNTLFVLTGDNGMTSGAHRVLNDKKTPYVTQLPFFVSWPDMLGTSPGTVTERLQNIDLAPTVCVLVGCRLGPYPNGQARPDGISFASLLLGRSDSLDRDAVYENCLQRGHWIPTWNGVVTTHASALAGQRCALALVGGCRWSFTWYRTGERELYDVSNGPCWRWRPGQVGDPCMLENLAGRPGYAWLERQLRLRLDELRRDPPAAKTPELRRVLSPASAADSDGDGLTDAFAGRWGATDPVRSDSDGDGLRDPAEDPDGDELGNLGEQRAHTSPSDPDSDHDGIRDGAEDANGNGIDNAREQDRRPVPRSLVPSLGAARRDEPISYRDGCHSMLGETTLRVCQSGDTSGATMVVLFGDSHAAQWLTGLIDEGTRRRWRIVSFTRSGCPSVTVDTRNKHIAAVDPGCTRWRKQVLRWISRHDPNAVVIANFGSYRLYRGSPSWGDGLRRTLRELPRPSAALVLADTPKVGIDVPRCLAAHLTLIAACERSRGAMVDEAHTALERRMALAQGASFGNLERQVCPYSPCPVIVDDMLVWRDEGHLTSTYGGALGPSLARLVQQVLDRSGPTASSTKRPPVAAEPGQPVTERGRPLFANPAWIRAW